MKRFFILACCILCAHVLPAQYANNLSGRQKIHRKAVNGFLQHNNAGTPEMRTSGGVTKERVIAESTRDNTLNTLTDSVNLTYSLFRTSTYDYNTMIFPYNYPYSASPMFNYQGVFTKPQVLFDTYIHWEVDPNTLTYGYYETGNAT